MGMDGFSPCWDLLGLGGGCWKPQSFLLGRTSTRLQVAPPSLLAALPLPAPHTPPGFLCPCFFFPDLLPWIAAPRGASLSCLASGSLSSEHLEWYILPTQMSLWVMSRGKSVRALGWFHVLSLRFPLVQDKSLLCV